MMNMDVFLDMLRQALSIVRINYYGRGWLYDQVYITRLDITNDERKALLDHFMTYHERVFCYEFYHQVRALMEANNSGRLQLPPAVYFQAELRKGQLVRILQELFQVLPLDGNYFPDFLLHDPDSFGHQELVMEVKSSPDLGWADIQHDLRKIQEFISKYGYRQGLFLTVNTAPEQMQAVLKDQTRQDWILEHLPNRSQIQFWCKETPDTDLLEYKLDILPSIG
jgi:hypothetical protein